MGILQKITTVAVLATCCAPLAGWAADNSAQVRAIIDAAIKPLMKEYDVPGMAVAVTVDGHAYFANYGVASRESNTPVSAATLFELGSVSKTFTATLASYAQGQGQLSLDDHPGKYMPQLKGHPIDRARLLNLGTYTAGGLPLQFPDDLTDAQMVGYFQHWQPEAAPDTLRRYSNTSIGLLGYLTGLALKRDAADAMDQQLFPLLGLQHTHVRMPNSALADYAWGYTDTNQPIRMSPGVLASGAYGVRSTAPDMLRYVQANIAPEALAQPMQRAVNGTHVGYYQVGVGGMVQGLGWEQYAWPVTLEHLLAGNSRAVIMDANKVTAMPSPHVPGAPTLYNKTGSTNGFGTYVVFVPAAKIGIVLLANKSYPIPARVTAAHAMLEQLARLSAAPAPQP